MLINADEKQGKVEQLYEQYRKLMYLCAWEILKDYQLAEDAVQEAFVHIVKHLSKIDEIKCNKTKRFVVIVVENVAIDIWRKEQRNRYVEWEDVENIYHFPVKELELELSPVEEAICSLPLKYRQIFQMKYACGYSNKEIADVLKIREGTLRQRLSRGKIILQKILEEMEVTIDE